VEADRITSNQETRMTVRTIATHLAVGRYACHAIVILALLGPILLAGCSRSQPQETIIKVENAHGERVNLPSLMHNPARVVVGNPEFKPGMDTLIGCGPCEQVDCGHRQCIAARKFISDGHKCAFCNRPVKWGDSIYVFFKDGKRSQTAGDDMSKVDYIAHYECGNPARCVLCGGDLKGDSLAKRQDNGWCHDHCLQLNRDNPELLNALKDAIKERRDGLKE
jgi:hypothetical protein